MVKERVEEDKPADEIESDSLPKGYDQDQVKRAVKALFDIIQKDDAKKKSLFSDEADFICIHVSCVKIPKVTRKNYRFLLPHGYLRDTSEVCLFVRNRQGKESLEYEETVRYYKNFLAENGVTSVHEVISVNQFKQEFQTHETRRRLANRFDVFLGDAAINDWVNGMIGKNFHRCKKIPNPVKLESEDLKYAFDKALRKTTLVVNGHGNYYTAKIGNTKQSIQQICENIDAFVKGLKEHFPGKWGNVKGLNISARSGTAIPLYFSIVIPNSVRVPKVKPRPENKKRPVDIGELSTLPDGYKVIVQPDGTVRVKKPQKTEKSEDIEELSNDEDFFDEDEVSDMEEDDGDEGEISDSKGDEVEQEEEEVAESGSDEDDRVEAAEEAYLQELKMGTTDVKKKRKGEEAAPAKKNQKKIKLEESLSSKKVKEVDVEKSKKILKGKEVDKKSLPIAVNSKKGRSILSKMQWHVEDIEDKSKKQKETEVKCPTKPKSLEKNSFSKSGAKSDSEEKVETQSERKSDKKVVKTKSATDSFVGAMNGRVKKNKSGKVKKG